MTSMEAVDCQSLARGSHIDVETQSRHYHIDCLGGNEIRISGHPEYCPEPVPAKLEGAVGKGGVLEFGMILCGMRLLFLVGGCLPVTTSKVVHVHVDPPSAVSPISSSSVN